jgi:hypothetical protein
MTVNPSAERAPRPSPPGAPPFDPDPDIIGNSEGNQRILKHDREAARELLEQQRRERS